MATIVNHVFPVHCQCCTVLRFIWQFLLCINTQQFLINSSIYFRWENYLFSRY